MDHSKSSETSTRHATLCWGEQVCDGQGWSFYDVFRHQFRISRAPAISSNKWKTRALEPFWIEHCPDLPATQVRNRRGQLVGWCLGIAVDANGGAIGCDSDAHITVSASFDAVERRLAQLAGRFALIVKIGDEARFYPDATSGLTAVANDGLRVIASTVTLAVNDEIEPSGGRSLQDVRRKPTLYLMDETPDARVRQLRGNHYVDLSTFQSHRFWPKDDTPFEQDDDEQQSVIQITKRLQSVMSSLVTHFECTLPITGGRDSRILAAALPKRAADQLGAFYVHEINWSTGYDVKVASLVAAHLDRPLMKKRVLKGGCKDELSNLNIARTRAQIDLATGHAHPHVDDAVLQGMHVAPGNRLLLRGGAVEVVQANKYPVPSRMPDVITPEFAFERLAGHAMKTLLKAYGETTIERYWEKYKTWFAGLPECARRRAVDVGHIELWLSAGMGAAFYAPRRHFYVNPFSDQMLLHQAMRFDPKARKKGRLVKNILDTYSPGLAEVPYDRQLIYQARVA